MKLNIKILTLVVVLNVALVTSYSWANNHKKNGSGDLVELEFGEVKEHETAYVSAPMVMLIYYLDRHIKLLDEYIAKVKQGEYSALLEKDKFTQKLLNSLLKDARTEYAYVDQKQKKEIADNLAEYKQKYESDYERLNKELKEITDMQIKSKDFKPTALIFAVAEVKDFGKYMEEIMK